MIEISPRLARRIAERTLLQPTPGTPAQVRAAQALRLIMAAVVDGTHELPDHVVDRLELIATLVKQAPGGSRFTDSPSGSLASFPMGTHPIIGAANPVAPPLLVDLEGCDVVGRVSYPATHEGYPGSVFGGFLAAGFDAVLGIRAALEGLACGMVSITTRICGPTPIVVPLVYRADRCRADGRKRFVHGTLTTADGRLTAECDAVFVAVSIEDVSSERGSTEGVA